MRRTLTVLVTAAAFLVPASAASADVDPSSSNASCSNSKGGNGAQYNLKGNDAKAAEKCGNGGGKSDPSQGTDPFGPAT